MNGRQRLVVQAISNARVFLEGLNVTAPELVAAYEELETACDDLRKAEARQAAALPGAHGRGLSNLRRELRVVHLLRIRKRGRVLLKGLPGIDDSLRVPHDRAPTQDLIAAAKRIADAVRPHAKTFYRAKFAADTGSARIAAGNAGRDARLRRSPISRHHERGAAAATTTSRAPAGTGVRVTAPPAHRTHTSVGVPESPNTCTAPFCDQ
jgi:hypothetical protein